MRFLRCLSCVLVWTALSTVPSFAAGTYSWPVVIVQPVTITNVGVPQGGSVVVTCQVPVANVALTGSGSSTVPVTASQSGGFSYTGPISVTLSPVGAFGLLAGAPPPLSSPGPQSGAVVSCGMYLQVGATQTPLGNTVTKPLP
jgi:hypothetical protein